MALQQRPRRAAPKDTCRLRANDLLLCFCREEIWKLTLNVKELEEEQNARARQARVEATEPSDQVQATV